MTRTPTMLGGLKRTTLWRLARGVKRSLAPPRHDEPLPPAQCRGTVAALSPPVALEVGSTHPWRFRVENQAGVAWASAGSHPVRLAVRWTTYFGEPFGDPITVPLPLPVYPGEPTELTTHIPAPAFVGDFVLEADLAQDGEPFAARNPHATPTRVPVPVVGRRATDIDYHAVYRTADLTANHWWVVGAYHSPEQYERSKADRRGMLVRHAGLTPDCRVLDVGCGTGQMADALKDYLSDHGAYSGTDIGREAVEFCQRTFRRRNFVFRQGEMTRIPFAADADGVFDLALYFSVFTHTFVDESALLLAETLQLLQPGGRIVADVITSPLVERGAGHRGEMVVNREHFLRLTGVLGLTAEVIGRWPWNPHAERLMFVLRRG